MRNLSVNRSNISKENISILKKIVFGEDKDSYIPESFMSRKEEKINEEIQDNALGVLYKNLHEHNKVTQKPIIYFFIGLVLGALSMLFLSAVVLVSDKDTIQTDVKTIKETIIENEKMPEQTLNREVVKETGYIEGLPVNEIGQSIYTVKAGDTLGGIVNRLYGDTSTYNVDKVEKFKEVNGLKSVHVLKIGQVLVVPE